MMAVSRIGALTNTVRSWSVARLRADWLIHGFVALTAAGVLLAYIQFAGPDIVGTDGFYHIKVADLIREQGIRVNFPWLTLTIIDEPNYTDHHMLLHVFQVPFIYLVNDLRLAAKLAPIALAAFAFMVFYLIIRRYEIRFGWLWLVLLFASSSPFLYRMSMARGQSLSLAFQLIAFHLIMTRNAKGLALLAAVFVWSYNGFPLLIPFVVFGVLVHYLIDEKGSDKQAFKSDGSVVDVLSPVRFLRSIEYKLVIGVGVGIAVGLVINPYFPQNVLFLWNHIVPKIFATEYATSVGNEWYPYNSWAFFTLSLVANLAYLGALLLTNRNELMQDKPRLFWFIVSTMYFVLLLKSRRFVEYFPPAAIMFFAFTTRDWLKNLDLTRFFRTEARIGGLVVAALLLALGFQSTLKAARQDIVKRPPTNMYKGGADWLAQNTPAGARVFHTDWDDFPKLFYFNTHNTYLVGLDPDFMRLRDEKLFRRYENITRGKVARPEDSILKEFGCEYVLTDNSHDEFIRIANKSPRMQKVFSDRYTTVYRVLEKSRTEQADAPVQDGPAEGQSK